MAKLDCTVFSVCSFLPFRDYLLCQRSTNQEQVRTADPLLMEFLCLFEELYGKEYCNINLHLHAHLTSCILDYDPVYSFWLFASERSDGILGSYKNNYHDIPVQLMRPFLNSSDWSMQHWPEGSRNEFSSLLDKNFHSKGFLAHLSLPTLLAQSTMTLEAQSSIEPMSPAYKDVFEAHLKEDIRKTITTTSLSEF